MATLQTVLGTTGDDTLTTDLLKDFVIDGLAGDDEITTEESASAFQIQARDGEDLIVAEGDVSNADKIKGGAGSDTFRFEGAVSASSIYGGKAADTIIFERSLTDSLVSGDTGNDTITLSDKVYTSVIEGGADDDSIVVNERLDAATINGGGARDVIDINDNSVASKIELGSDNDTLTITGKHSNLKAKGNAGDDTITIEAGLSGSGNAFYGGKDEDTIVLSSEAKVVVSGDKGDDDISTTADVQSDGASLYGGEGDDTIDVSLSDNDETAKFLIKGDAGDDEITGSTAKDTIYGGTGDDTVVVADGAGVYVNGDGDDDNIDINTVEASTILGGDGDDVIDVVEAANGTDGHTITGGEGADEITIKSPAATAGALDDDATVLTYSSLAEFLSGGDVVDEVTLAAGDAAKVELSAAYTITDTDEFDNLDVATRGDMTEGFILATAKSVTGSSTIEFAEDAQDSILGVDLSAGTTGASSIDASEFSARAIAITGGDGKNTIKGGAGADVLNGGEKADTIIGGAANDTITGNGGQDTMTGGAGNDDFIQKELIASKKVVMTEITDFTVTEDNLGGFSIENLETLGQGFDLVTGAGVSIAAGTAQLVVDGSGGIDIGAAANTIITLGTVGGGSTSEVETSIETGGTLAGNGMVFGAMEEDDAVLMIWDDNEDSYLGVVKTTAAIADGAAAAAGKLDVTKLVTLEGLVDSATFVTGDALAFVA